MFKIYKKKYRDYLIFIAMFFEMKRFWTMKVSKRGSNITVGAYPACHYLITLSAVFLLTACDTLEGVGNAVGG